MGTGGDVPEYEYEQHQQHAERGHVVHGLHQHYKLPPQGRKEPDQLQNSQQTEGAQHRQASLSLHPNLPHAVVHSCHIDYKFNTKHSSEEINSCYNSAIILKVYVSLPTGEKYCQERWDMFSFFYVSDGYWKNKDVHFCLWSTSQ